MCFVEGDLSDTQLLDKIFSGNVFDAVLHFAASSIVGESVRDPRKYFWNNVVNGLHLLDVMVDHGVGNLIFSSSAAVYGEPIYTPIDESHPLKPANPYGLSKLIFEQILEEYSRVFDLNYVSLRYFNAAGASPDAGIGEMHDPETHLIPVILQAALGLRESVKIFGVDYDTPDGSCVRDYIHVVDLASAHLLSLEHLLGGGSSRVFNLGSGRGFSVREVVEECRRVTGIDFLVEDSSRRVGDPAVLLSSSEKIKKELGWVPVYDDLNYIVESAWNFHKSVQV